jgi:hypothetical protein
MVERILPLDGVIHEAMRLRIGIGIEDGFTNRTAARPETTYAGLVGSEIIWIIISVGDTLLNRKPNTLITEQFIIPLSAFAAPFIKNSRYIDKHLLS